MGNSGMIHMDPATMLEEADGFIAEKEELEDVLAKMKERVERVCDSWEGKSSESFYNQYSELEPKMKEMAELIFDIAQQLRDISNAYSSLDEDIAGQLS